MATRALAARQSLRWAQRFAAAGDFEGALAALAAAEASGGLLPEPWQERRQTWLAASVAQIARR